jgi:hypothetical protein
MGFINFLKQNGQKQEEEKEVTMQEMPILQSPETENETAEQLFFETGKTPKEDICDFFHVNIYSIFKHSPELVERRKDADGGNVEVYTLKLAKPELNIFHQVDILKREDGSYDLHFSSRTNRMSEELTAFIHYCVDVLGPDFMQKRGISDSDLRDMGLGVFSRIWIEQVRIENIYFTLSLTLYITPQ